ncbi:MAG: NUDIX hydrolase [SAR324 cluster bacterium]|nr:NUDIX hydrolase [SAR324 cluster bacterium]
MPVVPRDASTVVLMRDSQSQGGAPEVLLVRRHAGANFAAGAHVFPGGALEEIDFQRQSQELSPRLSAQAAQAVICDAPSAENALGLFVSAIRETFEEVGILLARTENGTPWCADSRSPEIMLAVRESFFRGSQKFSSWMREQKLCLATEDLVYFAHWITPEIRPRRFDTRFFLAEVAPDTEAWTDGREVFDHVWASPRKAIALHEQGKLQLMTPTIRNLELLSSYPRAREAVSALRLASVPTILPKIQVCADGTQRVLHPGDEDYDDI